MRLDGPSAAAQTRYAGSSRATQTPHERAANEPLVAQTACKRAGTGHASDFAICRAVAVTSPRPASAADGPRPVVSVRVLGTPSIAVDEHDVAAPELRARQARVLLTLLVLSGGDGLHRDALGQAIWTTDRPRTWETTLSALVSRLRSMFARVGVAGDVFTFDAGVYRFVPPSEVAVDVDDAVAATTQAREAFGHGDASNAQALAKAAVTYFRGPLLPGEDSELVTRARQHVADVHGEALAILADAAIAQHRWVSAIEAARTLVAIQPLEEANHRRLLLALDGAGDRAGALQAYETYREVLARELGIDPSADTEKLHLDLVRRDTDRRRARRLGAGESADECNHRDAGDSSRRRGCGRHVRVSRTQPRPPHCPQRADSQPDRRGRRASASAADLALLLARQANELRDTPETRAALLAVLEEPPGLSRFLRTDAPVTAIAAGPTANTVVTGHANGNIVIWDPERREPLTGNASGDGSAVRAIAVNAETMRAASGTDDGLVQEWDVQTGSPLGDAITYLSPLDGAPVGIASSRLRGRRTRRCRPRQHDAPLLRNRRIGCGGSDAGRAERIRRSRPHPGRGPRRVGARATRRRWRRTLGSAPAGERRRPRVLRDGARRHGDCARDRSGRQGCRHERGQCSRPVGHGDGRAPR